MWQGLPINSERGNAKPDEIHFLTEEDAYNYNKQPINNEADIKKNLKEAFAKPFQDLEIVDLYRKYADKTAHWLNRFRA